MLQNTLPDAPNRYSLLSDDLAFLGRST